MGEYRVGDIVDVDIDAVIRNGSNLFIDRKSSFMVTRAFSNGEPSYNLKDIRSGEKVFLREDVEYAFIDDELSIVCEKYKYDH